MQLNLAVLFSTNADHAQEARALHFFRSWVSKGIVACRFVVCQTSRPGQTWDRHSGVTLMSAKVPGTLVRSAKTALKAVISEPLRDRMRFFLSRRWEAKFKGQPTANVFGAICKQGKWGWSRRSSLILQTRT